MIVQLGSSAALDPRQNAIVIADPFQHSIVFGREDSVDDRGSMPRGASPSGDKKGKVFAIGTNAHLRSRTPGGEKSYGGVSGSVRYLLEVR